jgi:hypothetical protein
MMFSSIFALTCLLLSGPVLALSGLYERPYDPVCAFGCQRAVSANMLSCSHAMPASHAMMDNTPMTSPQCFAEDTSYLTTLAWCLNIKCAPDKVPAWKLELFWAQQTTSSPAVPPKWTYGQALDQVTQPPIRVLGSLDVLNYTALANDSVWSLQATTMESVFREEALHAKFG